MQKDISKIQITHEDGLFIIEIKFFDTATVFQDKNFKRLISRMTELFHGIDMVLCPICRKISAGSGICQACESDPRN